MTRTRSALALLAALAVAGTVQAQPAAPKAAAPAGAPAASTPAAAPAGKALYPQAQFDFMLKERLAQGAPDTPELRNAIREELNTRELLVREAKKSNLDKNADIKNQMDLAGQTVLVRAYVSDWLKKNPIPDSELRKEYDAIKSQMGDKEYKVKHILVEKEDEAKDIIAQLQKGAKFDELAKQSIDPGSKDKGGDLGWASAGNFVKPFSDALTALAKGKYTETPVKSEFGYHVIELEDTRPLNAPAFEELKPRLLQQAQGEQINKMVEELRGKAKVN